MSNLITQILADIIGFTLGIMICVWLTAKVIMAFVPHEHVTTIKVKR